MTKTEIINLENPSVSCKPWADGKEVYSATGSITENGLVICGGLTKTGNDDAPDLEVNRCWIVGQTEQTNVKIVNQIEASGGSSGIMLNNESFLITGGTAPGGICNYIHRPSLFQRVYLL